MKNNPLSVVHPGSDLDKVLKKSNLATLWMTLALQVVLILQTSMELIRTMSLVALRYFQNHCAEYVAAVATCISERFSDFDQGILSVCKLLYTRLWPILGEDDNTVATLSEFGNDHIILATNHFKGVITDGLSLQEGDAYCK